MQVASNGRTPTIREGDLKQLPADGCNRGYASCPQNQVDEAATSSGRTSVPLAGRSPPPLEPPPLRLLRQTRLRGVFRGAVIELLRHRNLADPISACSTNCDLNCATPYFATSAPGRFRALGSVAAHPFGACEIDVEAAYDGGEREAGASKRPGRATHRMRQASKGKYAENTEPQWHPAESARPRIGTSAAPLGVTGPLDFAAQWVSSGATVDERVAERDNRLAVLGLREEARH